MEIIRTGCTRIVFILGEYAIKIPNFVDNWRLFLTGLLANQQEYQFCIGDWHENKLCPVLFYIPGGWLNIMPKVKVLTDEEFLNLPFDWRTVKGMHENETDTYESVIPCEWKTDSFGWLKNKIVCIDYGS